MKKQLFTVLVSAVFALAMVGCQTTKACHKNGTCAHKCGPKCGMHCGDKCKSMCGKKCS